MEIPEPAAAHERFVQDMAAMDKAYIAGRFPEWLKEYTAHVFSDFGIDTTQPTSDGTG